MAYDVRLSAVIKMFRSYFFSVLCVNIILVFGQNEYYKGYKVYNVKFLSDEQQDQLDTLMSDVVDFWRSPSVSLGVIGQAMVEPSYFDKFEQKLQRLGVEKNVLIEDVSIFITETNQHIGKESRNDTERVFDFEDYYRYDEILHHLNRLNETYFNSPTISFEILEVSRTYENRPLFYIKVTRQTNNVIPKPVVVVEAGIIPREWVTIPSALYVLDKLLSNETTLLDNYEWIIIPVMNPDGYEYTHTNLRLWMKNKSTRSHLGSICPGVNINRNFNIDWSVSGSSTSPCSHLYAGIKSFSEEESRLVQSILEDYGSRIQLYFSLQNTGGFISYPWQFERAASGMFRQHLLLSRSMVAAMNGEYNEGVGSVVSGVRASGSSSDYAREKGVLYTFNIDIIPVGNAGVMVPVNEIVNVAEDVWRAVSVAANESIRL